MPVCINGIILYEGIHNTLDVFPPTILHLMFLYTLVGYLICLGSAVDLPPNRLSQGRVKFLCQI